MWKAYTRVLVAVSDTTGCYVSTQEWLMDADRAAPELQRVASYLDLGQVDLSPALNWLDPAAVHYRTTAHEDGEWRGDAEALELYQYLVAQGESQRRAWTEAAADRPLVDNRPLIDDRPLVDDRPLPAGGHAQLISS